MASGKGNNHKNGAGGDCCSFCGAKRSDVEIMFQGIDGAFHTAFDFIFVKRHGFFSCLFYLP